MRHGLMLLTDNTHDFERMRRLSIVSAQGHAHVVGFGDV